MYNFKAVLEYWQSAGQQIAATAFTPDQVKNSWHIISEIECQQGKIQDHKIVAELLSHGAGMLLAPCYLSNTGKYFIPYLLQLELEASGSFKTNIATALPVIPKAILEAASIDPISIGSDQSFADYLVVQPPEWFDTPLDFNWQQQLAYAQQMLQDVTGSKWLKQLEDMQYNVHSDAIIFPISAINSEHLMDLKILNNKSKIELIAAERNSGKSAYARRKIIEGWIEAAVKQAPPPEYVWLNTCDTIRYTSIFACVDSVPLDIAPSDMLHAKTNTHRELSLVFSAYIKGKQVVRNWEDLSKMLNDKYAEKGGILSRIKQLQAHLKEAHARYRHMQVLQSIWMRQVELLPNWGKIFDVFATLQKHRLQRLFIFFKQNFPAEDVKGMSQLQLENIMAEKINRARNTERFVADALHQAESDLAQLNLISNKLLQWGTQHEPTIATVTDVLALLSDKLWPRLVTLATRYWQLDFDLNSVYSGFLDREPKKIDMLIVEHAEYVSPMRGAELLAISQRAIIMGHYNPICVPRFTVQTDFELCKQYRLAKCDADYEDLQFDGISAALGNLWSLAAQGKEADQTFSQNTNAARTYQIVDINGVMEEYLGSTINKAEVLAITDWLQKNNINPAEVCIYTAFAGQAQYIKNELAATQFAKVPVLLVTQPNLQSSTICLFSPVYTAADPGPYNFDRGVEILDNMVANTQNQLVVFGDQSIFKPELHSAAGKFAKLFAVSENNFNKATEVNCV